MTAGLTYEQTAGRTRRKARLLAACALTSATVLGGGVAYAHWTTSGSATGSASTGTTVALTTSAATPSGTLVPGGTAPLVVTVTNPNPGPVTITSVQLDTTRSVVVSGAVGTCTSPPLTVSAATSLTVAGGATTTLTVPNAVALGTTAASGCQGATFTLPVTLSGRTS